ncbi:unnamed protein product [Amoebophrya sp. A25]|nr:unnamed protein product [Amoebophrya sp. A25]|eukprot:GSA25T00023083001.1
MCVEDIITSVMITKFLLADNSQLQWINLEQCKWFNADDPNTFEKTDGKCLHFLVKMQKQYPSPIGPHLNQTRYYSVQILGKRQALLSGSRLVHCNSRSPLSPSRCT